ncbi:cytochrome ubiquinol oxidase subunit II [Tabrizicola sp. J26]|uniref:cytochrome c oxidase subunit II n=1 Tax=Alitabrizicola rongguiensis TaxID=2909234 RepID=UPI001F272CEC|nr:cytochrome ubiquinol oxidase subunit II [Tabrizicola rongguiensis]MCF1709423.1 cytochrome ubiquinol oxidase subunit II [Tabrizicola rongguiensis]
MAEAQRAHLITVTAVTMVAVLPVLIGVPLILWRYRRVKKGVYRPDFEYSRGLELAMWGVPFVLFVLLSILLWRSTIALDPYRPLGPDPLEVQVVGLDWKWVFLYPEQGVATVGTLVLPEDRPVTLKLTTDTVMQSFMVPALSGQIYAMPGMVTTQNLIADRTGVAEGRNMQFNGPDFAQQTVRTEVLTEGDWTDWMEAAASAPVLDVTSYAELARAGTIEDARLQFGIAEGPIRLRLGAPDLFSTIVDRYHRGQPVPASAQPGAPGYQPEALR